jgi:hypothetical protein
VSTGKKHSEKTKAKISASMKGHRHCENSKQKMSEIRKAWHKENSHPMTGREHSVNSKRKISYSLKAFYKNRRGNHARHNEAS